MDFKFQRCEPKDLLLGLKQPDLSFLLSRKTNYQEVSNPKILNGTHQITRIFLIPHLHLESLDSIMLEILGMPPSKTFWNNYRKVLRYDFEEIPQTPQITDLPGCFYVSIIPGAYGYYESKVPENGLLRNLNHKNYSPEIIKRFNLPQPKN